MARSKRLPLLRVETESDTMAYYSRAAYKIFRGGTIIVACHRKRIKLPEIKENGQDLSQVILIVRHDHDDIPLIYN